MQIRIRIQLKQILWRVFLSCKRHKRMLKSKKQWRLCKFTLNLSKLAVITNFLAFFVCFYLTIFCPLIRIQEWKWMRIHADPEPQPWSALNPVHFQNIDRENAKWNDQFKLHFDPLRFCERKHAVGKIQ